MSMKTALALVLAFTLLSCGSADLPRPAAGTPSAELAAIAEEVWERRLEQDVPARIQSGRPVEHLPDPSLAGAQRNAAFARQILARLDRIDGAALNEQERLTRDVIRWRQEKTVELLDHFWFIPTVTPYGSPFFGANQAFTHHRFETPDDAARYLRLLQDYGRFVDSLTEVVREQRRRGILLPKAELPLVRGMLTSFRGEPGAGPLAVAESRLAALSPEQRAAFQAAVRDAITKVVNPSLQRLLDLISEDYEAAAPEAVGLAQYPGGDAAYRFLIRLHTSLDLDPAEVHRFGLAEVERIERELDAIRQQVGFRGSLAEFHRFLKTDARFFARSPEEIGERLTRYIARIEPQIPRFFARTPGAAYDVRRLDPSLEGAMTFGFYQVPTPGDPMGHYYYNGSKPGERNLLFAASLMAHEIIPGHHFQMARQQENEALPAFRREQHDNAFTEGWGEYAAALGTEMGLYEDPYDRAGRLMMDMMLSCRLVVDTGMNALGWPRERAMGFLREHTMLSDTEIATETLRYAVDIPGQALAYKMGSARMLALRAKAEAALGPRFDVRAFHEWILDGGSLPLPILERYVEEKISQVPR